MPGLTKKLRLILPLFLCTSCMLQHPVRNTDIPDATGGPIPTRVGESAATTWFWLWKSGDDSVERAKLNGGISEISSVTKASNSFLGFIKKHTTTVRGN